MATIVDSEGNIVRIVCDWCEEEIPPNDTPWYQQREFELSFTEGIAVSGDMEMGGWHVEHLCDDCIDQLREKLVELGINVTPYYYTYDWLGNKV